MQNCRSNALDNNDLVNFTSSRGDNSATNDSMVMKIAHAELYTTSNSVCNFEFSTCNTIISLDNNNSVKFTSSKEDNSTTSDSMVMKIAYAQLHIYTTIMYKFQGSKCKTVGEKLQTKLCPPTDGQTAMVIPVYPPPLCCVCVCVCVCVWGGGGGL